MSRSHRISPDLERAERIDGICDQFESECRAGRFPRIEDLLAREESDLRPALLQSLVELEIELLSNSGQTPSPETYRTRFPDDFEQIEYAFLPLDLLDRTARRPPAEESTAEVGASPDPRSPPDSGQTLEHFGRFEIRRVLGEGGFGTVYRAYDPQLDRDVALKVPRAGMLQHEDDRRRFVREARAAAGLHDPHICPVFEVGAIDGCDYLVMGLIDGCPLSALYARKIRLTEREAASVVRTIALALQEAHDKGIVHRDLKPANIMLSRKGEPVVMDFGLARRIFSHDTEISAVGQITGTPAYMSPEQARGDGRTVGPAADIYSLGVMLYELLCGRRPFTGSVTEVIGQILHQEPDPPSRHRPELDPELDRLCRQAMARVPERRPASMREFADALRDWLSTHPELQPSGGDFERLAHFVAEASAFAPATDHSDDSRAVRLKPVRSMWKRRPLVGGLLLAALTILCGLAAGLAIFRNSNDDPPRVSSGAPGPSPANRRAAEWAIQRGGGVSFLADGERRTARRLDKLPDVPFDVVALQLEIDDRITDDDLEVLRGLDQLEELHIHSAKVTGQGLSALTAPSRLRLLDLYLCPIDDRGIEQIVRCTELEHLSIRSPAVSEDGVRRLARLWRLEELFLDRTQVGDDGLAALAGLNLRVLLVSDTNVSARGLAALAGSRDLYWLDASLSAVNGHELARLAGQFSQLRILDLSGPNQTDADLAALRSFAQLEQLMLGRTNQVTGATLAELAACPRLERLDLTETAVTDAALAELSRLPALSRLVLRGNRLTDAGIEALTRCVTLRSLDLRDTDFTADGIQRLQAALPDCTILFASNSP